MAITFINSTAGQRGTAASTMSILTQSSKVGGAALVLGIGLASSAVTVSTVTDNAGNVFLKGAAAVTPKPAAGAELWYALNVSSASTRVSVTLSGTSSGSIALGQWNGVSTANALLSSANGAITANSTVHSFTQLTPSSANAAVITFYRATASTMVPTALDGGQSAWVSTLAAVRTIGGYIIQTAASTATGQWRTAAATSTGGVMHAGALIVLSDTQAAPPPGGGFADSFAMMGVQ